jgi:hypothetical protein
MGGILKPKKVRKVIVVDHKVRRKPPKNDYLKYLKVARYWIQKKYNINLADLEMLLFMNGEKFFARSDFKMYNNVFSFDKRRFDRLMEEGWFEEFRERKWTECALYEMSKRGKSVMNEFYRKLEGVERYSEDPRTNPVFKKSEQSFQDKRMAMAMKQINEENKKRRETPSHYDYAKHPNL